MEFDKEFENLKNDLFSLPWLVNGSLDKEETNRLKSAVENSPELQKELNFLMSMRTQVKNSAQQSGVSDMAWQRLARDMKKQPKTNNSSRLSVFSRKLSSYAAVAATLVLGVYLSNDYMGTNQNGYYEPLFSDKQPADALNQVQLVLRFNASMSRLDIDKLLNEYHLLIISGPSSVDLYHVRSTHAQDSDALIKILETLDDKIEYVQINE